MWYRLKDKKVLGNISFVEEKTFHSFVFLDFLIFCIGSDKRHNIAHGFDFCQTLTPPTSKAVNRGCICRM
jgi:hypothetical protein